ncbi:MAG: hypothetical protein GY699_23615, partial [Desulfobacteraceae bacterium]|nr:hypothetical protein [Desulfobacteraceae bacterium]
MPKSQVEQSEALLSDEPIVKISKSEGIFNGIAMGTLAIYVIFIIIIIGSVVVY